MRPFVVDDVTKKIAYRCQAIAEAIKNRSIYVELGPTTVLAKNGLSKNKELLFPTSPTSKEISADAKAEQCITPPAEKCENSHIIVTSSAIRTLVNSQSMPTPAPTTTSHKLSPSEAELKVCRSLNFSHFESSTDPKESIS
ncbi:unnamed protein product [Amaranthus hypochondriacus]